MNYENLTDDELIVAVAEARGYKIKQEKDKVYSLRWPDLSGVLTTSIDGVMAEIPDYRQPAEYMALMGEIWKKDQNVYIKSNLIGGIPARDDVLIYGHYWDDTSTPAACKELWRAICIAWLKIVGGKDE